MPLPQVNDRLKEIPAQALRTLFATVGQLLLVADRLRARAAEQLSGDGEAHATPRPAQQARRAQQPPAAGSPGEARPAAPGPGIPGEARPAARPGRRDRAVAVSGQDGQRQAARRGRGAGRGGALRRPSAPAGTPDPAPSFQEPPATAAPGRTCRPGAFRSGARSTPAPAEPIPPAAEYTPTEPVPAEPAPLPSRARRARPLPAGTRRARPAPPAPAEPAVPARAAAAARPGSPPRPQLRPAFGGFAAGPVARARRGPGARPARLREGTRGPASRGHHVRAPSRQAQRRQLRPAAAASRNPPQPPPWRSTHHPRHRSRSAPSSG